MSTAPLTAMDVANFFILKGIEDNRFVTNTKVQKLLYYAQGWYMANFKRTLFPEPLEAWDYGPVCPEVYTKLSQASKNRTNGITTPVKSPLNPDCFLPDERTLLETVWKIYGHYSAYALSEKSHQEAPWKDTFDLEGRFSIIPTVAIYHYFSSKLAVGESNNNV